MSAEMFGLTQQILMLISAYINTGVCGKLHIFGKTVTASMAKIWYKFHGPRQICLRFPVLS